MSDTHQVLRSTVTADAMLEVVIETEPIPVPDPGEVLIRIDASPINPSDLGMLLAAADLSAASGTTGDRPTLTAPIPESVMKGLAGRVGTPMPVGNEGSGEVIAAGAGDLGESLIGRIVAVVPGGMYGQYRVVPAEACLLLNDGTSAEQGASCFVNPLTALGMVETMRLEGHTALVHSVGASNLGQMLQRICLHDGVDLVNIVRREEHVELLKSQGATWVCNSADEDFLDQLTSALVETKATIGFEAIGGGDMASNILSCMERALNVGEFSRYGSATHKQVYIYGGLDRSRTTLNRNYGMAWGLGGWLLTPFLIRVGADRGNELRQRVADEIDTTFASHYTARISLTEVVDPDVMRAYAAMATGEKFLVTPNV
jgi:NADPH2:quinone reductase